VTWRTMTPTERKKNEAIIREAIQPIFDRITEIEAQVTRLRAAIHDLRCSVDASEFDDVVASYLHPGDLYPIGGDDEIR
jgi:hypothetical protein